MKHWYQFNYHNGAKVTLHYTSEAFVERVRKVARERGWDVVVTMTSA